MRSSLVADLQAMSDAAHEERVLKRLLNSLEMLYPTGLLVNKNFATTGEKRLAFSSFLEEYRDFPAHVGCRRLPAKCLNGLQTWRGLSLGFMSHKLMDAYADLLEENGGFRPVTAMVVTWPTAGESMVFHNWKSVAENAAGARFMQVCYSKAGKMTLYAERWGQFCDAVMERWTSK